MFQLFIDADLVSSTTVRPAPISIGVSVVAPTVTVGTVIDVNALSMTVSVVTPTVTVGVLVTPESLTLSMSLVDTTVSVGQTVNPDPLSLAMSVVTPTEVTAGVSIEEALVFEVTDPLLVGSVATGVVCSETVSDGLLVNQAVVNSHVDLVSGVVVDGCFEPVAVFVS